MDDGQEKEFLGKVALITGAAAGIGLATAELLASRGASIILADIKSSVADAAIKIAEAHSVRAIGVVTDVRSSESVNACVSAGMKAYGRIDVLANVAGIYPVQKLADLTDSHVQEVMDINVMGTVRACRAVAPHMLKGDGGAIVNIASGAAFRPYSGTLAYSASKGAVLAMSRVLALELAPNIRVNVVSPGATNTETVRSSLSEGQNAAAAAAAAVGIGRLAEPDEIAEAIAFLASDRARFITGQTVLVNGGSFMR